MMNAPVPYLIGEVLFDTFPGGRRVLGGAPFNVAWHLQAFAQSPFFISAVGQDEPGEAILAKMREHGMNTAGVQQLGEVATGRVDVVNADTSPSYEFPERSAWDCVEPPAGNEAPPPSILYQGSLFLRQERSRETSFTLGESLAAKRFVDVNLREPFYEADRIRRLVQGVHCLKVSEDELKQVAQWFGLESNADRTPLARRLCETAELEHVFVTMGPEGAEWITREGENHRAPAVDLDTFVDTVGAGDASAAVAILGLINEWPIPLLLDRAMTFAAHICTLEGAIPERSDFYDEIIKNWK